jgi:hypothetical protein
LAPVRATGLLGAVCAATFLYAGFLTSAEARRAADPAWPTVLTAVRTSVGSYRKQTNLLESGHVTVQAEEFVDYDLKAKWLDRRLTRIEDVHATREKPALRFVYRPGRYLMWNPNVAGKCGTPWVRLSERTLHRIAGGSLDFFSTLEPAAALSDLRSAPRIVRRDATGTTFRMLVPGDVGLPASSAVLSHLDTVAKLHRGTTTAYVHVASHAGPIRITVDITKALEAIGGQSFGDAHARQVWTLERPPHPLDRSLPTKVAPEHCLS